MLKMANYVEIDSVIDGDVRLAHKMRTDTNLHFKCLTWRQIRASTSTNRRFYLEQGKFWTIPLHRIHSLLKLASDGGLFTSRGERWPGAVLDTIDSADYSGEAHIRLSAELLTKTELALDAVWQAATDVRFLVGVEPDNLWRKALIFSPSLNLATLRSLTRDPSYAFTYSYPLAGGWLIDKSMLDADAEIHEFFLSRLNNV
jgi:hypothetical protein